VRKHLQALTELPPEISEIYRVLGQRTVALAKRRGMLSSEAEEKILKILEERH
jgi:hypothetical protein